MSHILVHVCITYTYMYTHKIHTVHMSHTQMQNLNTSTSSGALDMGGASMQIAFLPSSPSSSFPKQYGMDVTLYKKTIRLYSRTYLCYGMDEALRRLLAHLAAESSSDVRKWMDGWMDGCFVCVCVCVWGGGRRERERKEGREGGRKFVQMHYFTVYVFACMRVCVYMSVTPAECDKQPLFAHRS